MPNPPPPTLPPFWESVRAHFIPLFLESLSRAETLPRTFANPKKKYLREPGELVIYHSIRASEEAYRVFPQTPVYLSDEMVARVAVAAYDVVLRHELTLAFDLFNRHLHPAPPVSEYRKIAFLVRYESDGPSGSAEAEAEAQMAHRFFHAVKPGFHGPDGLRQVMGNVYGMVWQTGDYIIANYIARKPG